MPVLDGFAAGRTIKRELPATRLIYVTGNTDPAFVTEALQVGASALVHKTSAGRELLDVIRRAMAGETMAATPVSQTSRRCGRASVGCRFRPSRRMGEGRYVVGNEAVAALTGFSVQELEAMSVLDLTPALQSETGERVWSEFLAVGEQWGTDDLRRKDGVSAQVYYYARAHVLPDVHLSLPFSSASGSSL